MKKNFLEGIYHNTVTSFRLISHAGNQVIL